MLYITKIYALCAQVLVVDLGNSRFLRQVGRVLNHVSVFLMALHDLYGSARNYFSLHTDILPFSL